MTHNEFIEYMRGLLSERDELSKSQVAEIKNKLEAISTTIQINWPLPAAEPLPYRPTLLPPFGPTFGSNFTSPLGSVGLCSVSG